MMQCQAGEIIQMYLSENKGSEGKPGLSQRQIAEALNMHTTIYAGYKYR